MRPRIALAFFAAFVIYAGIMVVWTYPLITRTTTDTILQVGVPLEGFKRNDLRLCIGGAARNADALLKLDLVRLIDNQACYPMPMSATLGEHLIELGLLSLPVYAFSRNPILAYNSAVFLSFLIAGMGMFSLIWYWTRYFPAALVAGLLFAFHPLRASEIAHLHVIGIHWLPLILLFFDRLLRFGKARDSVLLAFCGALQCLVGSYPLVIMVGIALPFGIVRLIQHRNVLDLRRIAFLSTAILLVSGVALAVLLPYFIAGNEWQAVKTRASSLILFSSLLPGHLGSIGIMSPSLALILPGLWIFSGLERWVEERRDGGRRPGEPSNPPRPIVDQLPKSPGIALLLGALFCALMASRGVLWPGGPALSGLYPWLASHFWVLGTVRVPATVQSGVYLGLACLAGLGLAALQRFLATRPARLNLGPTPRVRQRLIHGMAAAVVILVGLELFYPTFSTLAYGTVVRFGVESHVPDREVLRAYSIFDERGLSGPILDIPFPTAERLLRFMPGYILFSGYHQRATAACHNSHIPPTYHNVARTVGKLPSTDAIHELAAIGLRNLVIHHAQLAPLGRELIAQLRASSDAELVYQGTMATSFRLVVPLETHANPSLLEPLAASRRSVNLQNIRSSLLDITVENTSKETWALPQPIRAEPGIVRWYRRENLVGETEVRVLLPLALAGYAKDDIAVDIGPPPDRCYSCDPEIELPRLAWKIRPGRTNALD